MTEEQKTQLDLCRRYQAALHAMQSGVALKLEKGGPEHPKHYRVGINAAMVDASAMAKLLIRKGIITQTEYLEAVAVEMEAEKARYEAELSKRFGGSTSLA